MVLNLTLLLASGMRSGVASWRSSSVTNLFVLVVWLLGDASEMRVRAFDLTFEIEPLETV
jgi:hypothetical protein